MINKNLNLNFSFPQCKLQKSVALLRGAVRLPLWSPLSLKRRHSQRTWSLRNTSRVLARSKLLISQQRLIATMSFCLRNSSKGEVSRCLRDDSKSSASTKSSRSSPSLSSNLSQRRTMRVSRPFMLLQHVRETLAKRRSSLCLSLEATSHQERGRPLPLVG